MGAAHTSAARTLFGTDGVRGVAGEFLTAELALALARAATARRAESQPETRSADLRTMSGQQVAIGPGGA